MLKLANAIAVIGLTALLAVTGLVLLEVLLRTGPVLALRDQFHHVDEALRHWGMDGLSDLYAPLGIVAVAACLPAMLATRSAITVRFIAQALPWRLREGLEAAGALLLLTMFTLMSWWLTDYTADLWQSGKPPGCWKSRAGRPLPSPAPACGSASSFRLWSA